MLLSPLLRGDYLLSHFRSTIGVVRLNFSVRNGKRWNPHAIITLVSFSRPAELFRSSWPVMVKKSCDGNAGFSCEKLLERSAFLEAISLERVNLERYDTLSPQRFLYSSRGQRGVFSLAAGFCVAASTILL